MTKHDWQYNCWTGDSILNVTSNGRIMRTNMQEPYLYTAEFWGDYSSQFPIKGPCRGSLQAAKKDLAEFAKQNGVTE